MKMDRKQFDKLMTQLVAMPIDVMREAEPRMVSFTSRATGNARSKTNLKGKTTILADYDYADRIDNGHAKGKFKKGFTDPTIDFIEKQIMRDIGRM